MRGCAPGRRRPDLSSPAAPTVEVAIPAHARIGPATIETVYIVSGFKDDAFHLEISASVRGELGPFKASVDRIGVGFLGELSRRTAAISGRCSLTHGFKPPSGVGLTSSGGGISGGGFLYFDPARANTPAALELQIPGSDPPQGRRRPQY